MREPSYRPSLTIVQLLGELARLLAEQRRTERLICLYLADLADRVAQDASRLAGYGDVYHLARCKLGLGVRSARERIRMGRALRELPAIEEAFVAGELTYSRVREVTRVARPEDEAAWLTLARELPMRSLERRVVEAAAAAGASGAPCDHAREKEPAETRYLTPEVMELRLALPAEAWALLQRAMEGARRASESHMSDAEALAAVARDALARQDGGDADPRRTVVLYECKHCERAELDTGAEPLELPFGAAASLGCGAEVSDLATAGRVVKRGGAMPAGVRRAVLLRDRCRCRTPGCGRRRYVDVHHLEEQCRGGIHSRQNCLVLCTLCHRLLHEGKLHIEGNADGALSFYDPERQPMVDPFAPPLRGAAAMTHSGSWRGEDDEHPDGEPLAPTEAKLLAVMGRRGAWHSDALCDATGLPYPEVACALVDLQLSGRVVEQPVGMFAAPP